MRVCKAARTSTLWVLFVHPVGMPIARIIHGSSENAAKRQAFRPLPMGLWLQRPPPEPWVLIPTVRGLAAPVRLYVCNLQACPFAPNLSCSSVKQVFMKIRGKTMTLCLSRGEPEVRGTNRPFKVQCSKFNVSTRFGP